MDIIRFEETTNQNWDKYIYQLEGSTFKYTSVSINFEIEYAQSIIKNESFIALLNGKPIAATLIYINENEEGIRTISWGERYCMAPLLDQTISYKLQERYLKEIMKYVCEVEEKYNCQKVLFAFDGVRNPEQKDKISNYNYLKKYFYQDDSTLTQLIDLRQEETLLYADIKNGHKGHIKKGNDYEILFFDSKNIEDKMIDMCRHIYEYDAGMVTRNSEMMHHYLKFIKSNNAVLGFARLQGEYLATIIATFYKKTAYYSLYAEMTDKMDGKPAGHKLQWELIKYLKAHEIEFYEMGEQIFGKYEKGTEEEKLVNISTYKREFGGYTVPVFRGIKVNR